MSKCVPFRLDDPDYYRLDFFLCRYTFLLELHGAEISLPHQNFNTRYSLSHHEFKYLCLSIAN